jgi:hypothetical protein
LQRKYYHRQRGDERLVALADHSGYHIIALSLLDFAEDKKDPLFAVERDMD